jgi:hypothetical protein
MRALLTLLVIALATVCYAQSESEQYALQAFAVAFPELERVGWNATNATDACSWIGVYCGPTGVEHLFVLISFRKFFLKRKSRNKFSTRKKKFVIAIIRS